MTYESPYGKRLGLRDRIADWVEQLGTDKSLPWVGLGLIADLRMVAEVLPDKIEAGPEFDPHQKTEMVRFDVATGFAKAGDNYGKMEFDL